MALFLLGGFTANRGGPPKATYFLMHIATDSPERYFSVQVYRDDMARYNPSCKPFRDCPSPEGPNESSPQTFEQDTWVAAEDFLGRHGSIEGYVGFLRRY